MLNPSVVFNAIMHHPLFPSSESLIINRYTLYRLINSILSIKSFLKINSTIEVCLPLATIIESCATSLLRKISIYQFIIIQIFI
ncbi:unnamed protein product [Brassica rapa subsp. narinosa]